MRFTFLILICLMSWHTGAVPLRIRHIKRGVTVSTLLRSNLSPTKVDVGPPSISSNAFYIFVGERELTTLRGRNCKTDTDHETFLLIKCGATSAWTTYQRDVMFVPPILVVLYLSLSLAEKSIFRIGDDVFEVFNDEDGSGEPVPDVPCPSLLEPV